MELRLKYENGRDVKTINLPNNKVQVLKCGCGRRGLWIETIEREEKDGTKHEFVGVMCNLCKYDPWYTA